MTSHHPATICPNHLLYNNPFSRGADLPCLSSNVHLRDQISHILKIEHSNTDEDYKKNEDYTEEEAQYLLDWNVGRGIVQSVHTAPLAADR